MSGTAESRALALRITKRIYATRQSRSGDDVRGAAACAAEDARGNFRRMVSCYQNFGPSATRLIGVAWDGALLVLQSDSVLAA